MSNSSFKDFQNLFSRCSRVAGFTGAGISTDSGIPDYRSAGGIWEKYRPVYFDEFVRSRESRLVYWRDKEALWPAIRDAEPNAAHELFVRLHREGRLVGVITQNIDGLHERSGLPTSLIVNLHGSALTTSCLSCDYTVSSAEVYEHLRLEMSEPVCPSCGGALKPDTISFGQRLSTETLERAYEIAGNCELMLVLGSTLVVYPAAELPEIAGRNGAKLCIVTRSETPLDESADFVFHESISDFARTLLG